MSTLGHADALAQETDDLCENGKAAEPAADNPSQDSKPKDNPSPETKPEKVRIDVTVQDLPRITRVAWRAITKRNTPPTIFRFANAASWIETDDDGQPLIVPLDHRRTRNVLANTVDFYKPGKKGEKTEQHPAYPPTTLVENVLATPNKPLPVLRRIVPAPIVAPSGEIRVQPGYDPETLCIYHPARHFTVPEVSPAPTPDDIARAKEMILTELLSDFPFVSPADKTHAVAALLLPFARTIFEGPTPLHLIEKSSPGSGASLLADVLTYPFTGLHIAAMTEGRDEDEWRKRITAKQRQAPPVILIDNLRRELDSASLAAALTLSTWEDRLLGTSQIIRLPNQCLWMATGNNPKLSHEMTRRSIRIRIEIDHPQPWRRTGFRHPELQRWVEDHRPDLVWAALTLIRAWFAAGQPSGTQNLGMFENWSSTIGGICEIAGLPSFLGNLNEFYEEADSETERLMAFCDEWWSVEGDGARTAGELLEHAEELDLGQGNEHSRRIRLGKLLSGAKGRRFGPYRIEKGRVYQGSIHWQLVRQPEAPAAT